MYHYIKHDHNTDYTGSNNTEVVKRMLHMSAHAGQKKAFLTALMTGKID